MTKTVTALFMFIVAFTRFGISVFHLNILTTSETFVRKKQKLVLSFFRVFTVLATSAVEIYLSLIKTGFLYSSDYSSGISIFKIEYNNDDDDVPNHSKIKSPLTLAKNKPPIINGDVLAVFILVYLFNPINIL